MQPTTTRPPGEHPGAAWLGLEGARVLVAGAGGIGAECIAGYAAAGARVAVTDQDEARLQELARTVPGIETVSADLTARGAGARVVAEAVDALGGLDVLLHCVGVNDRRPVL